MNFQPRSVTRPLWGATLYVPATKSDLAAVREGSVQGLTSMVICLEDAVRDDEVPRALANLETELKRPRDAERCIRTYVRPRDYQMLEQLLEMRGIETIDGMVLPKSNLDNIGGALRLLAGKGLGAMPTIETAEFWDPVYIAEYGRKLRGLVDDYQRLVPAGGRTNLVDCVRVGGNDLLSTISARRSRSRTLYDGPVGRIMPFVVGSMATHGIPVSSPVFEHYTSDDLLTREIQQDIEHGIMNKTAIHPRQVAIINAEYAVTPTEIADALDILDKNAKAVFGNEGSMCEPRTHSNWAKIILERQRLFGTAGDMKLERQAA